MVQSLKENKTLKNALDAMKNTPIPVAVGMVDTGIGVKLPYIESSTVGEVARKFSKASTIAKDDAYQLAKGMSEGSKKIFDVPHVKEARDIIAERTKGLDLNQHPTTTKQMSSKKMKALRNKIDNRTITKQEYADYIWNKKFAKRWDKGVKEFWYQEQQRILNNEPLTREWSQEQLKDILAGKTPKFDGKPIAGHHSYSRCKISASR